MYSPRRAGAGFSRSAGVASRSAGVAPRRAIAARPSPLAEISSRTLISALAVSVSFGALTVVPGMMSRSAAQSATASEVTTNDETTIGSAEWLSSAQETGMGTAFYDAPRPKRAIGVEPEATPTPQPTTAKPSVAAAPKATKAAVVVSGDLGAPCAIGSAVERGLRPDTIKIYRQACVRFPGIKSYGGVRADSMRFHPTGRALDMMLTPGKDSAMGWEIASFLVANASTFNVDHIIFEQKIWTPSNPTWRPMANRGSTTANHYDHVHVAVK